MNKAILDTDILSYFLKGDKQVLESAEFYLAEHDSLAFTEITYFEILAGLEFKLAKSQKKKFQLFSDKCLIYKLTENSIRVSAKIYGELRRHGVQMGTPDLLIAGIAIDNDLVLISNNIKDYQSIKDLNVETWK